jgi:uncharacterized protein (TIGR00255 family)
LDKVVDTHLVESMTGFAHVLSQDGSLDLEVKTVNARFLEIHCRLPDELRMYEPLIRESCQKHLKRGKVECRLTIVKVQDQAAWSLDEGVLQQLTKMAEQLTKKGINTQPSSFLDWIRYPNLVVVPNQTHWDEILPPLLETALGQVRLRRQGEGGKLKSVITNYANEMISYLGEIKNLLPQINQKYREKIQLQLQPLMLGGIVDGRSIAQQVLQEADKTNSRELTQSCIAKMVEAEIAISETRSDVAEEVDRLTAHLQSLLHDLQQGGSVGKKLDFLMQELLRETNTLASKVHELSVTQHCVAMKLCIEHMREQVQNLV